MNELQEIHTAMPSLRDKRIVISGGTTGIGRAVAALLGESEAKIFTFGRHEEELNDALEHIRSAGGQADGIVADAASEADIERIFEAADEYLGGIDVLIANAGLSAGGVEEQEDWRYVIETNLIGYIACTRQAVRRMKDEKGGHIVLIGSMSAVSKEAGASVYVATKCGVQGFAEALRKEVNPLGIKVSLIEPGAVGSDMQEESPKEQREHIRHAEMLRAEDIAVAVHYVLTQPWRCDVVGLQIRPLMQPV